MRGEVQGGAWLPFPWNGMMQIPRIHAYGNWEESTPTRKQGTDLQHAALTQGGQRKSLKEPESWGRVERAALVSGVGEGPGKEEKPRLAVVKLLAWVPPSSFSSCLALRPLLIILNNNKQ